MWGKEAIEGRHKGEGLRQVECVDPGPASGGWKHGEKGTKQPRMDPGRGSSFWMN